MVKKLNLYMSIGKIMLLSIKGELQQACSSVVGTLAEHLKTPFIIGGLFAVMKLMETVGHVIAGVDEEDRDESDMPVSFLSLHLPTLKANDINVYHGHFKDGSIVMPAVEGAIEHIEVDGISKEVNTVKCLKLSGQGFLNNNGINATAVCIEVCQIEPLVVEVKVHPSFWEFVLLGSERVLKPSKTDVKAHTLVRLAFKSFELDIPFNIRDPSGKAFDVHSKVLYKSHIDRLKR
jgi:hypothetical protein